MPAGDVLGLSSGAGVSTAPAFVPVPRLGDDPNECISPPGSLRLPLGDGLLGRVLDSQGKPLDKLGPLQHVQSRPLDRSPINAMERDPIRTPIGHRCACNQRAFEPLGAGSVWACLQGLGWAKVSCWA